MTTEPLICGVIVGFAMWFTLHVVEQRLKKVQDYLKEISRPPNTAEIQAYVSDMLPSKDDIEVKLTSLVDAKGKEMDALSKPSASTWG